MVWFINQKEIPKILIRNNNLKQNDFSTCEEMKHVVLHGLSLGLLLFLFT